MRVSEWGKDVIFALTIVLIVFAALQRDVLLTFIQTDAPFLIGARNLSEKDQQAGNTAKVDETMTAELTIPQIGVRVPIVWSANSDENSFQKDLRNGIVHYPGTVLPGLLGNALLAGHSSNFFWEKGDYPRIFSKLNHLKVGDEDITVTYKKNDSIVKTFYFRVSEKNVVTDDDERLFAQTKNSTLTLVTCWPLGTSWRRLMVSLEQY
jgi:LPXTG-site transpeptidase (sortase) family protein